MTEEQAERIIELLQNIETQLDNVNENILAARHGR